MGGFVSVWFVICCSMGGAGYRQPWNEMVSWVRTHDHLVEKRGQATGDSSTDSSCEARPGIGLKFLLYVDANTQGFERMGALHAREAGSYT